MPCGLGWGEDFVAPTSLVGNGMTKKTTKQNQSVAWLCAVVSIIEL